MPGHVHHPFVSVAISDVRAARERNDLDAVAVYVARAAAQLAVLLAAGSIGLEWYSNDHKALLEAAGW